MRLLSRLWIIVLALVLSHFAIASYQSAEVIGGFRTGGYVDTRINGNTAIVYYDGTRYDSPQEVKRYLLFRCAQVTVENGYDYFVITSSSMSRYNIHVHTKEIERPVTSNPRMFDQYYTTTELRAVSVDKTRVPKKIPCDPCAPVPPQHGASAVIKMFNGDAPENIPNAFDAQDVIGHLAPETF
jgi:hypothetical protein